MKLDALDHPKTLDLASRLGVKRPTVIGHLELLWAWTSKMAPQGNIGKWPDGAIAEACYWEGDPRAFIQALLDTGLLDPHHEHRLLIHDWAVHAQSWVRMKLKKAGLDLIIAEPIAMDTSDAKVATAERIAEPIVMGTCDEKVATTRARVPSHALPSEAKPSVAVPRAPAGAPTDHDPAEAWRQVDGIDPEAMTDWIGHRDVNKPPGLAPHERIAVAKLMAGMGDPQIQRAAVQLAIANGWRNLRHQDGSQAISQKPLRVRTAEEIEAEENSRAVG